MASVKAGPVVQLSATLPLLPKGYKALAFSPLSPATTSTLHPTGPAFHAHARRVLHQRSFEEDERLEREEYLKNGGGANDDEVDEDKGLGDEEEDSDLLESDPKLWKEQDHYAVLGLQELRWKATPEQIKKAHRRKVLRHHPDKKASAGGDGNDDSFFKCIAKAMEVLSNPEKRRQFDSVDEAIDDDDVPETKDTTPETFFDLWSPVFAREGRFSKEQPVPVLGDANSTKREVEMFYDFFYSIDSWRSFEYLDKDSPEGTDSRDEKRHQEKKNKSERAKRKKEDIARVRLLVDKALSLDPRIKVFKAEEKAAKELKKRGGVPGVVVDEKKKAEEEKAKKEEEERVKKAEEEAAAQDKLVREAAKKAKASAGKTIKKDKKAITALVTSSNYFLPTGTTPSPAVVEAQFAELDLLFGALEPEEVNELKVEIEAAKAGEQKSVLAKFAKKAEKSVGEGKFVQFA